MRAFVFLPLLCTHAAGEWFPVWGDHVCSDDGAMRPHWQRNGYEAKEECCEAHFRWNMKGCLGAEGKDQCLLADYLGSFTATHPAELVNGRTADTQTRLVLNELYNALDGQAGGAVSAALLNETSQMGAMEAALGGFAQTYSKEAFKSPAFKGALGQVSEFMARSTYEKVEQFFGGYWNFRQLWPFPEMTPQQVEMLKSAGVPVDYEVDTDTGAPNKYGYAHELMNSCMEPGSAAGQLDGSVSGLDGLPPGYRFLRAHFGQTLKGASSPLCWPTMMSLDDTAVYGNERTWYGAAKANPDTDPMEVQSRFSKDVFGLYLETVFNHEEDAGILSDQEAANLIMVGTPAWTAEVHYEGGEKFIQYPFSQPHHPFIDPLKTAGKKKAIDAAAEQARAAHAAGALSDAAFEAQMAQVTAMYESGPVYDEAMKFDIAAVRVNERMLIHSVKYWSTGEWALKEEMTPAAWALTKYQLQGLVFWSTPFDKHNWVHFAGPPQLSFAITKGWTQKDRSASVLEKLTSVLPAPFLQAMQAVAQARPDADLLAQVLGAAQMTGTDAQTLLGYLAHAGQLAADWYVTPTTVEKTREGSRLPNVIRFLAAFQNHGVYISQAPILGGSYTNGHGKYPPVYHMNGTVNDNPPLDHSANPNDLRFNGNADRISSPLAASNFAHHDFMSSLGNRTFGHVNTVDDFFNVESWLGKKAADKIPYATELYQMWTATVAMVSDVVAVLRSQDCEDADNTELSTDAALQVLKHHLRTQGLPVDATAASMEMVLATLLWQQTVAHSIDHEAIAAAGNVQEKKHHVHAAPTWTMEEAVAATDGSVESALAFIRSKANPQRDAQIRTFTKSAAPHKESAHGTFDHILLREPYATIPVRCHAAGRAAFDAAYKTYQDALLHVYEHGTVPFKQALNIKKDLKGSLQY